MAGNYVVSNASRLLATIGHHDVTAVISQVIEDIVRGAYSDFFQYASNFTPQVKEARNQSQIFNRKSISRNITHRQSYHLIQINYFFSMCLNYPNNILGEAFWPQIFAFM